MAGFHWGGIHTPAMDDVCRDSDALSWGALIGASAIRLKIARLLQVFLSVLLFLSSTILISAKPPRQTEVIIIGAGLSGLAAAYELRKAHVPYHILEIAPRVGGRVRTVRYQRPGQPEIYADSGMEEYWQSNPAVQILKELRLPISSDVAVSTVVLENKLYPLGKETPADFKKTLFSKDELESLAAFNAKVAPWIHELQSRSPVPENPLTPAVAKPLAGRPALSPKGERENPHGSEAVNDSRRKSQVKGTELLVK